MLKLEIASNVFHGHDCAVTKSAPNLCQKNFSQHDMTAAA